MAARDSMFYEAVVDEQTCSVAIENGRQSSVLAAEQTPGDALRGDVATLLSKSGEVSAVLHQCCQLLVERMEVAFARIWTLEADEQVLKLQASAGIYTRLDGSHARVPVGQFKIGLIATQRRPHLTNSVQGDRLVHDQDWARGEGMTAFAGYPLLADGEVVGVLAMFSRRPIAPAEFANLEIIAGILANYIRRKQLEHARQVGERQLGRLAERIGVIPWEADARTWRFTYVGPQAEAILGYPLTAWYKPDFWLGHIHPDDRDAAAGLCQRRIEQGEASYQLEYRMLKTDGTVVWILDIVNVVGGPEGPLTLQGFLIDITERKLAEHKAQESAERLQVMADALPVLISYIDAQGRYQFNNAAYEQWFGVPRQQCQGRLMHEILGEDAYAVIRSHVEAALAGEARTFEERVPYQGAGTRDVQVHYVPHRTGEGKVAGFFALIIDLSDRKRAEEAIRDREAQLSAILNTAADAIITIDEAGIVESVNPSAERLFGYSAAEIIGQNVSLIIPSPLRDAHHRSLARYTESGVGELIGRPRELSARRKDGTIFPVELSVSEVRDGKRWFTGIVHDLSQRKALEQQVLEVSAQEQQRIARELHDEVGQELTGLGLLADALSARLQTACPAEQPRMARLTEGLERVRRQIRALCHGLMLTDLDPNALQLELEDLAVRTTDQTGIRCTLECNQPLSLSDSMTAKHLYRIAQEAVGNALRHGRPTNIWIRLAHSPDELRLSVRDDGVGVEEQTPGGQGMGIPTMRYRAGLIGGQLQIVPAEGGGTLVTCTLSRKGDHGRP